MTMSFWLLKSEPTEYSWQKMISDDVTSWNGIKNYQAQSYIKSMLVGDYAFFYHTGKEKSIMGIVKIIKEFYYIDDSKFGLMNIKFFEPLNTQVSLKDIKKNPLLNNMVMLRQPRLSISPVSQYEWNEVVRMSKC